MKKFSMLFLAAAIALVGAIVAPNKAEAVPAFARQVGVPCYSCHYQHIPKLNAFGREFKLGGYTQAAQDLIQDEHLSLPPVMNIGVLMKVRFIQQSPDKKGTNKAPWKDGTKYGEWNIPDEIGIFPAGRVGENMGALLEIDGHGSLAGNKFIFSKDFGGVRGGLSVFATRDAGAGYGMELFNTGLQRNQSGTENKDWMPNVLDGAWNTGAQGISVFAGSDLFFLNVGLFAPACNGYAKDSGESGTCNPDSKKGLGGNYDVGFNFSNYIRAAVTPKVADGLDLAVGLQLTSGKTKVNDSGNDIEAKTDSMAIDAQAQTSVSGMSLEVIAGYATVKGNGATVTTGTTTTTTTMAAWNGTDKDQKHMWLGATLGIVKGAGVKLGYGSTDNGAATNNAMTETFLGGWWAPAQNVDLSIDYVMESGDARKYDNKMTLMLEFAF